MLKKILGLFLCIGIGASVWVLPQLWFDPLWYVLLPLCVACSIGFWSFASEGSADNERAFLSKVGIALALGITLGYRFVYLDTVPGGIDHGETPFFTNLSAEFLNKGFRYTPYVGYMHTLYAYVGAVGMFLSPEWEWGFRFATAVVSALTVVTSFFAIRALTPQTSRAAWIGAGLLASSPWHIWISRFLMQKFLITLCESITLLGLIVAVTGSRSLRRYGAAMLAAFGFVLGLHAYWGCYVLAATWVTFLVYLALLQRSCVRQWLGPLIVASILAFGLSLPAISVILPQLGASGYVKTKLDYGGDVFVDKVIRNLEFLFWALSSSPSRFGPPFVTAPIAFLFVVGLVRAVKQFRSSIPSALIVINFSCFLAGIAVTWAHDMYMTGLIFSVYCLAGLGAVSVGQALMGAFGGGREILLGIAPLALVCHQAVINYREALLKPTHTFCGPYQSPATQLRDEMRLFTLTHSVWLPRLDFGESLWSLRKNGFPEYAFVDKLNLFSADVPWFDLSKVEGTSGIELYLRPTAGSQLFIDNTLKKLYPHLVVNPLPVPPPHDQLPENTAPRAIRISISLDDVRRLKEVSSVQTEGVFETRGFLALPREGQYSVCTSDASSSEVVVGNQPVEVQSCSAEDSGNHTLFLGTGLHPVQLKGQSREQERRLIVQAKGGEKRPLFDLLWGFSDPSAQSWANENLGDSGKPTSFVYEVVETYTQKSLEALRYISGSQGSDALLAFNNGLYTFDRRSNKLQRTIPAINSTVVLGRPGTPLLIREKGSQIVSVLGNDMKIIFDLQGTPIVDFDNQGEKLALLCADGKVIIVKNGSVETILPIVQDGYVTAVAWAADSLFVATLKGIYFKNLSTGESGKIAGEFSAAEGLSSDGDGNLYAWAPHHNGPARVFSNSGRRLFNSTDGSTVLFVDKEGKPINASIFPKFFTEELIALDGNSLHVFRRRAIN